MSRRLSVAYRPGAVGGRGGLPPAGLAAPHRAERGALIQNRAIRQRLSAVCSDVSVQVG